MKYFAFLAFRRMQGAASITRGNSIGFERMFPLIE
jgi:hypothetical protein